MTNILVNGLNSKTGGGRSILNNYLTLLKDSNSREKFFVLTPDKDQYKKYACDFITIIDIERKYKRNIAFPLLYFFALPKLLREYNIDCILNFGDIVIPGDHPQLYYFDWSYAVYPDSIVWRKMDVKSYLSRKIKLLVLTKYIGHATLVIAQTRTIKEKLESLYGLKNVEIIPNAVSIDNLSGGESYNFGLPQKRTKLLYLAYYYSHKNFEVLIPLAKKIKENRLGYTIITTIDGSQHSKAKVFLGNIEKFGLEDVIKNIGPVEMKYVPTLYQQSDGLLMPTLLESFSGTYVEAMFHEMPIFTSDLDFAKDVCGEAAFYFDPLNADSILSSINQAFEDVNIRTRKIEEGKKRLCQLPSWEQTFGRLQELLGKEIDKCKEK